MGDDKFRSKLYSGDNIPFFPMGTKFEGFSSTRDEFWAYSFSVRQGLTGFVTQGCFKGVLNIELNTTSKPEKQTLNNNFYRFDIDVILSFKSSFIFLFQLSVILLFVVLLRIRSRADLDIKIDVWRES